MKIYYVDAENVGIDFLEEQKISVLDKVFVFSNNESIKSECEKLLYTCVSGYSAGKNQADFYMIAHLTRLLSQLSDKEKGAVNFIFCYIGRERGEIWRKTARNASHSTLIFRMIYFDDDFRVGYSE